MSDTTPARGLPRPPHRRKQPTGRRGRPPLPAGEKCSSAVLVRLRPSEHDQLRTAAQQLGESLSEFVLTASLRRAEAAAADYRDIGKTGLESSEP